MRAAQSSAGLAYYALFSIFPLLLLLVVGGSFLLQAGSAQAQVLDFPARVLPVPTELVSRNIERVLQPQGSLRAIDVVGFLWSALGVFANLARSINLAWVDRAH